MKPVATAITIAEAIATAKAVTAAKAITTAKAVAAAKPAAMALRARRLRFGCAGVDAVHGHDLQSARGLLQITDHRRARRHIRSAGRSEGGRVTERVAAVFKRDEAVAFCCVEPFDRSLGRSHRQRSGTFVFQTCHEIDVEPCRITNRMRRARPAARAAPI